MNTTPNDLPQLLTLTQFAQRLSVCKRTVERLIAAQQIRACKVGRSTRVSAAELVRYIASVNGSPSEKGTPP
jgi:excisionase family DNA binding protein